MSRVSVSSMEANSIKYMLKFVEGYETVKAKEHPVYKTARSYFSAHQICFQNFYKFYRRFVASGRDPEKLLPLRRGPKPKYSEDPSLEPGSLEAQVFAYRRQGFNKFTIVACLKRMPQHLTKACSPSTVYRICQAFGVSRLTKIVRQEVQKIVKTRTGELVHVDCHYLPKGLISGDSKKQYFVLGVIDDYSRIAWVEVMASTKSLDATFAMMDAMLVMNNRYGIQAEEVLTDNGAEFCSPRIEQHPFERLLVHFGIKHRCTKPYRPQTNGKIERFWRSFHDDVIEGSVFETLDALKDAVVGYNFYYNEHRPHQGIGGKKPIDMLPSNPINSGEQSL